MAGRLMAQPVYPQLRKYPVRSGTYASCQIATLQAWLKMKEATI
jgi:hypothetical protein